jgi:hypothetical protein
LLIPRYATFRSLTAMLAKYIVDGHGDLLEVNRCDL